MRLFLILALLVLRTLVHAQFIDDFSDGDLTVAPPWSGHLDSFTIDTAGMLRLDAPASASTAHLSTASAVAGDAVWSARIRLEFDPSSANHALLVCMSDSHRLTGSVHGYAVRIGSSDDDIDLLRLDGGSRTTLIDGPDDLVSDAVNDLDVRVERTMDGWWTLLADTSRTGTWDTLGTVRDDVHRTSVAMGLVCVYTATRSDRFAFDDVSVSGLAWEDRVPPHLVDVRARDDLRLRLVLDEPLFPATPPAITRLDTGAHPDSIGTMDSLILLRFGDALAPGTATDLLISGLQDTSGNVLPDTVVTILRPPIHRPGDVLITEILADDHPSRGLPYGEYVEVYNAVDHPVDLTGWTFVAGSDSGRIDSLVLGPADRALLCEPSVVDDLERFAPAVSPMPWPFLNNGGERIALIDARGRTIHSVTYADAWYGEARDDDGVLLGDGGVSLEMVDLSSPCSGAANWAPSSSGLGGTPGLPNMATADPILDEPPIVRVINMRDLERTEVVFDRPVGPCPGIQLRVHTSPGVPEPSEVRPDDLDMTRLQVRWTRPITDRSVHRLSVDGLCTCGGEPIDTGRTSERFGVPRSMLAGDLVIQEVLTDPVSGGVDFVEVVNRSAHMVDLKDVVVVRFTDAHTDSVADLGRVTEASFQIAPGRPIALTPDLDRLRADHPDAPAHNILAMDLPSLPDDGAVVAVAKRIEAPIDRVEVRADLHHPMLPTTEGVSLERLDVDAPSNDPHNWASAPAAVGYATPGQENAQQRAARVSTQDLVTVVPPVFTPNGDGQDDLCAIHYALDHDGYLARVRILDRTGQPVRHLVDGAVVAPQGTWTWDGTDDRGRRAAAGPYVVNVRLVHPQRRNRVINRTVVSGWDR